jgi:hypothetical protein
VFTVTAEQSVGTACRCYSNEEVALIYYPFSLKKRDKSVGSVGCVGKSQKSPEISQ